MQRYFYASFPSARSHALGVNERGLVSRSASTLRIRSQSTTRRMRGSRALLRARSRRNLSTSARLACHHRALSPPSYPFRSRLAWYRSCIHPVRAVHDCHLRMRNVDRRDRACPKPPTMSTSRNDGTNLKNSCMSPGRAPLLASRQFLRVGRPWDFGSEVGDAELPCQHRQSRIGCPQFQASDKRGCQ
jgi:hypothetical protein